MGGRGLEGDTARTGAGVMARSLGAGGRESVQARCEAGDGGRRIRVTESSDSRRTVWTTHGRWNLRMDAADVIH